MSDRMNAHGAKRYVGIDKDLNGGMTHTGKIIRDAWAFGIISESETCAGWRAAGIEDLWGKVSAEWERHGYQVGQLPDELRARYLAIQNAALDRARAAGWDGAQELADDD